MKLDEKRAFSPSGNHNSGRAVAFLDARYLRWLAKLDEPGNKASPPLLREKLNELDNKPFFVLLDRYSCFGFTGKWTRLRQPITSPYFPRSNSARIARIGQLVNAHVGSLFGLSVLTRSDQIFVGRPSD